MLQTQQVIIVDRQQCTKIKTIICLCVRVCVCVCVCNESDFLINGKKNNLIIYVVFVVEFYNFHIGWKKKGSSSVVVFGVPFSSEKRRGYCYTRA